MRRFVFAAFLVSCARVVQCFLTTTSSRSLNATVGSSVSFTCHASNSSVSIRWYRGSDATLIHNGDTPSKQFSSKYDVVVDRDNKQSTLNIYSVTFDDVGKFFCSESGTAQHDLDFQLHVNIVLTTTSSRSLNATVGSSVSFTCHTSNSSASIRWYKDNDATLIHNGVTLTKQFSSKYDVVVDRANQQSTLTVPRVSLDDAGKFICSQSGTAQHNLDFQLHVHSNRECNADVDLSKTVEEGQSISIVCDIDGDIVTTMNCTNDNGAFIIEATNETTFQRTIVAERRLNGCTMSVFSGGVPIWNSPPLTVKARSSVAWLLVLVACVVGTLILITAVAVIVVRRVRRAEGLPVRSVSDTGCVVETIIPNSSHNPLITKGAFERCSEVFINTQTRQLTFSKKSLYAVVKRK